MLNSLKKGSQLSLISKDPLHFRLIEISNLSVVEKGITRKMDLSVMER